MAGPLISSDQLSIGMEVYDVMVLVAGQVRPFGGIRKLIIASDVSTPKTGACAIEANNDLLNWNGQYWGRLIIDVNTGTWTANSDNKGYGWTASQRVHMNDRNMDMNGRKSYNQHHLFDDLNDAMRYVEQCFGFATPPAPTISTDPISSCNPDAGDDLEARFDRAIKAAAWYD